MDLNKAMLIGNIVNDPEMRTTPNGQNVTSFRVATNRRWKNQSTGEYQEDSQFHSIVAWGKLAEICSQYMGKGMKVYIEGRISTRSWDDAQTGQKRYMTELIAENAIMLGRKDQGAGAGAGNSMPPMPNNGPVAPKPQAQQSSPQIPSPEQIPTINVDEQDEIRVEDIPF